tara:strand:+ start:5612 stop:6052 length:441 start_codon:yes stop_codon:yes gene_type:complete
MEVVAVIVDVADVVVAVAASTTDAAMTTCEVITRTEGVEATPMAEVAGAGTTQIAVDTTAIRAVMEASRTSLHHSQIHGHPHQVAPTLCHPHRRVGCHLHNLPVSRAMEDTEDLPEHRLPSALPGWATHRRSMVDRRLDKPAITAR